MSQNIAIVGAGITGMCTALSLAKQGHHITLFERDTAPPPGDADEAFFAWQRRGAAQHSGRSCALQQNEPADRQQCGTKHGKRLQSSG